MSANETRKMSKRGDMLFELPIGDKGNLVCTAPKDKVYLITFTSPPDNRLVTVGPDHHS